MFIGESEERERYRLTEIQRDCFSVIYVNANEMQNIKNAICQRRNTDTSVLPPALSFSLTCK